jgi:hypothetical protein
LSCRPLHHAHGHNCRLKFKFKLHHRPHGTYQPIRCIPCFILYTYFFMIMEKAGTWSRPCQVPSLASRPRFTRQRFNAPHSCCSWMIMPSNRHFRVQSHSESSGNDQNEESFALVRFIVNVLGLEPSRTLPLTWFRGSTPRSFVFPSQYI